MTHEKFATWPTKIIALSFISLTLLANVLLHNYLFGGELPSWYVPVIDASLFGLAIGAVGRVFFWIKGKIRGKSDDRD